MLEAEKAALQALLAMAQGEQEVAVGMVELFPPKFLPVPLPLQAEVPLESQMATARVPALVTEREPLLKQGPAQGLQLALDSVQVLQWALVLEQLSLRAQVLQS